MPCPSPAAHLGRLCSVGGCVLGLLGLALGQAKGRLDAVGDARVGVLVVGGGLRGKAGRCVWLSVRQSQLDKLLCCMASIADLHARHTFIYSLVGQRPSASQGYC